MSYQKFTVDNPTCSRRFHITFDDDTKSVKKTSIDCPHCGQLIWQSPDHSPVKLAREENLVKTTSLSRQLVKDCKFKDSYPAK